MTPKPFIKVAVAALLAIGGVNASEVPAAKIDSGLGDLPPYGEWKNHPELSRLVERDRSAAVVSHRVSGEKLDSGLGELPPYREWKHHPELARLVDDTAADAEQASLVLRK